MTKALIIDIGERALLTFAQAWLSVWIITSWSDLTDVALAQQAAVAGLAAALSVAKSAIASRLGEKGTAALLPAPDAER